MLFATQLKPSYKNSHTTQLYIPELTKKKQAANLLIPLCTAPPNPWPAKGWQDSHDKGPLGFVPPGRTIGEGLKDRHRGLSALVALSGGCKVCICITMRQMARARERNCNSETSIQLQARNAIGQV